MANKIKETKENEVKKRTASVLVKDEKTDVTGRTCPVYVVRDDVLSLEDITNEKPIDYPNEIHISWLDNALNQFAKEQKYSAWDLIQAPQGAWVSSAYGNKCGIVAGADSQVIITLDNGNTWETVSVIADLSCIAFGSKVNEDDTVTNRFIALSSTGQGIYSDDNGKTWQGLTIPNDNYTGIVYIQGKFIAISSTGKIYTSYDMGIIFNELTIDVTGFQFTAIATDGDKKVMIVGSSGTNRALYSDDVANKFKETNLAQNTWTSVVYGEGKFIAVSTDGDNNIAVFDVVKGGWNYTQAPTQEEWRSVSYGARVFTAVATSGKVISSLNGNRWLAVTGHNGEWNTILRTDYFFIALSIADNEQGYNAMRSSNAGMTLNEFATLQEVIEQEPTLKAISPQVLIDYLRYRTPWKLSEGGTERKDGLSQGLASDITTASKTLKYLGEDTTADKQSTAVLSIKDGNIYHTAIGKEKGNIASYDENNYINALVENANSFNIQVIDENSPITSYDEITKDGYYYITKDLANKPLIFVNSKILKVQTINNTLTQTVFKNNDFYSATYEYRTFNTVWEEWQIQYISQDDIDNIDLSADNITVSKESTQTAVNTFLMVDKDNRVVKQNILDISQSNIEISKSIIQTAINTLLVTDKNNNIANINIEDFSIDNAVTANDIKYNIIDNDSPITDVKDLPYGWSIVIKENLINAPMTYGGFGVPIVCKKKINGDVFEWYMSYAGVIRLLNMYYSGGTLENGTIEWDSSLSNIDLSISTVVSKTGDFSASQTVLMVENDVIKKVPKGEIINNLPVGFIYIQLRGQSTPDQLFGSSGKWQDISSQYAGEFFRAVGGNSASFGSKQNEGLPNITGDSGEIYQARYTGNRGTGALRQVDSLVGGGIDYAIHSTYPKITLNANLSNSIYGASTHVTPYNSAVRIWKKIA